MRALWAICASLVLGVLTLTAASAGSGSADRVALIIGNANYPDSDVPLTTPLEDARALGAELQRRGFAVDIAENVTKRSMREAVEKFLGKLRPGSVALVYFSGYGIQAGRQNYLIPVDAQIWSEADVQRDGLNVDRLLAELDRRSVGTAYVVLDAAHRNPFERRFRSFSTGFAPIKTPPANGFVISSSAPAAVLKQESGPRSLFATELVKQIQATGGVSPQVFDSTRTAVASATRDEQVPWIFSAPKEVAATAPREGGTSGAGRPSPASATSAGAGQAVADAGADYRNAQQTGTKQAYADFLAKHKTGPHADLARREIERLDAEAAQRQQKTARLDPEADSRREEPVRPKEDKKPGPRILPYSAEDEMLIKNLSQRVERDPSDSSALFLRGQIYAQHEDFPRALADFDRVVRLNPRDVEALNNRCWVRAILNELDSALVDCNEALKLRPNFLDALDSRGFVNLKIGLPRLAVADYDAALKVNAKHASALYGRGLARLRSGETAEGKKDIERARSLDPDIADEFARLGVQ